LMRARNPLLGAAYLGIGGLIGSAPWWLYAFRNGLSQLIWELRGGAIAGVEGASWALRSVHHFASLVLLGSSVTFGLRPPWEVQWLVLPLLPLVLIFWLAVMMWIFKSIQLAAPFQARKMILAGVLLVLALGFIFSPFGADPSGRYFTPAAVPLALFAAEMVVEWRKRWGRWAYLMVALIVGYNLGGTIQSAWRSPTGITTQFYAPAQIDHRYDPALIEFLLEKNETRGYSNYWVSYPLAFLSKEKLLFVPRLPYHPDFRYTERDDRFAPYTQIVDGSQSVAYITTHHPALDMHLREQFAQNGVSWQEAEIGDYRVFYQLSKPIRPLMMGLGESGSGIPGDMR
jgi:hypothetical protein